MKRIPPAAPDVPPRDRALVAASAVWIAAAAAAAFAERALADALFFFVAVPLLAGGVAGCVLLVWAGAAAGTRWAAGRPLGRAPAVLAAVLLAGAALAVGGGDWLADRGDAAALRRHLGRFEPLVAALRAGGRPLRPGADVGWGAADHVVVLTAAPLRVASLLPRGWAGDPTEWIVYDPTGAVARPLDERAGTAAASAVPGPLRDGARLGGCTPVAPAYYHCWAE